jgi:predicted lipid-binding transport protein (Tim44 family)
MDQAFDPLNLLFLAVAVVVFLRLRSVLGRRTGFEKPPLEPGRMNRTAQSDGNVVTLPPRTGESKPAPEEPVKPVWEGFAAEGTPLANGLAAIGGADGAFSPKEFLGGAKAAYEMIVTAFAEGDRATLKNLLSRDVLDGFAKAIDARERAGERLESKFVGIDKAELMSAVLEGRRAMVEVSFVSQIISATLDKTGAVIDGDPREIREVNDVWTFERDVSSRDPNWKLVATEDRA